MGFQQSRLAVFQGEQHPPKPFGFRPNVSTDRPLLVAMIARQFRYRTAVVDRRRQREVIVVRSDPCVAGFRPETVGPQPL